MEGKTCAHLTAALSAQANTVLFACNMVLLGAFAVIHSTLASPQAKDAVARVLPPPSFRAFFVLASVAVLYVWQLPRLLSFRVTVAPFIFIKAVCLHIDVSLGIEWEAVVVVRGANIPTFVLAWSQFLDAPESKGPPSSLVRAKQS
jgi:hypothetical protein